MWSGIAGFAGDVHRFVHGFEELVAFVAHVRRVDAAERPALGRECDHFVGVAVAARFVDQARGKPDSALFHRLRDMAAHLGDFVGRRVPLLQPHHVGADAVVPDEHRVVDGRLLRQARREDSHRGRSSPEPGPEMSPGMYSRPGSFGIVLKPQFPLMSVVTPWASLNSMPG